MVNRSRRRLRDDVVQVDLAEGRLTRVLGDWCPPFSQKPWIAPIPGTTKVARMKENIAAADLELTAEDLRRSDDALAQIKIHGDRYPAHPAARVGK